MPTKNMYWESDLKLKIALPDHECVADMSHREWLSLATQKESLIVAAVLVNDKNEMVASGRLQIIPQHSTDNFRWCRICAIKESDHRFMASVIDIPLVRLIGEVVVRTQG